MARKAVGVGPLTWDYKLANYAKAYGNLRSRDCSMIHSNGPYGENLYRGSGQSWTPGHAVAGWLSENRYYNRYANTCRARDCGHYTQIVWRSTKRVGCARVVCARGVGVLFVCEYYPPGNFNGERPY
ncbi:pathogenesis-related protein PR-1-like [Silene latifolia]|uniref:pathogenesis-related protein PR-1-like n=1 Tax=Silene latifolia TaxID=37657 RepID=UPI003D76E1A6